MHVFVLLCTWKRVHERPYIDVGGLCLLLPPDWPGTQRPACLCLEPALCQSLGSWSSLMSSLTVCECWHCRCPRLHRTQLSWGCWIAPAGPPASVADTFTNWACYRAQLPLSLKPSASSIDVCFSHPVYCLSPQAEREPAPWGLVPPDLCLQGREQCQFYKDLC